MESLAKFFGHDFKDNKFKLFDKNDNLVYFENFNGNWSKRGYDKNNNQIYFKNLDNFWSKCEYNNNNNKIYYENSRGEITDNRPKTFINKEIIIDGKKYKLVEGEE